MCNFVAKGRLSTWFSLRREMNHFNHYNWKKMLSVNAYCYKRESIDISLQDSFLTLQWCFGNQKSDNHNVKNGKSQKREPKASWHKITDVLSILTVASFALYQQFHSSIRLRPYMWFTLMENKVLFVPVQHRN